MPQAHTYMQYICISMSAGMLLLMFIFHDLVGSFFFLISLSSERKAHSFATLLLAGSIEHLLRRTTVEVVHVIHCVK